MTSTVIIPIHLTRQIWRFSPNQPDAKQMSYTDDPQYVWWAEDEEKSLLKTEERGRKDRRGKSSFLSLSFLFFPPASFGDFGRGRPSSRHPEKEERRRRGSHF